MKYFRLLEDIDIPKRWHLASISDVDNWMLSRPPMLELDNVIRKQVLKVGVRHAGTPLDFSLAGYAGVPVVSFKVLQILSGLHGFTAIPAKIGGFQQKTTFHVLHIWDTVDCVDEGLSEFEKYQENDPVRPDLEGHYSAFFKLIVDPTKIREKHIFRLERSGPEIIISEDLKKRFEDKGVTGVLFQSVSDEM